ncbi:MAG TPA: ATP-binding protein [Solirubrobacteraceae bacterium]|nr:ATP-binding protein [Solirubrobacteraceae bacterium]
MGPCGTLGVGVIEQPSCVRLELENRPEHVSVVRAALSGVAEAAGFDEELSTDLKTAVSEACNNVVIHAYEGQPGPMRVLVSNSGDRVDVVVRDTGTGIRRLSSGADHMGLGLALISALADQAEFNSPTDGGTEVRMRFRRGATDTEAGFPGDEQWPSRPAALVEEDVVMWCEPVPLVRHLVGRVARAAAASSHFTMTGASDLYAINDAMAGFAEVAADGHLVVGISSSSHRLTLEAGPVVAFEPGEDGAPDGWHGDPAELSQRRAALAELVDELSFENSDVGKLLHLLVLDRGHEATG